MCVMMPKFFHLFLSKKEKRMLLLWCRGDMTCGPFSNASADRNSNRRYCLIDFTAQEVIIYPE